MGIRVFIALLLLSSNSLNGQFKDYFNWPTGAAMNTPYSFRKNAKTIDIFADTIKFKERLAFDYSVISDSSGDILFYTFYNQKADTIFYKDGTPLNFGVLNTNPSIDYRYNHIVRQPGQFRYYYLFQVRFNIYDPPNSESELVYSIIDANHFSGKPTMIRKNQVLLKGKSLNIDCNYNQSGNIELLAFIGQSDSFYQYTLTQSGAIFSKSIIKPIIYKDSSYLGYYSSLHNSKNSISPLNKYALLSYSKDLNNTIIHVIKKISVENYSFVGQINTKGVTLYAYSPNENMLYLYAYGGNKVLIQYQLDKYNTFTQKFDSTILDTIQGSLSINDMQLGPDGRIYCRYNNDSFLGNIKYPNQKGQSCEFIQRGIFHPKALNPLRGYGITFPNMLDYFSNQKYISYNELCKNKLGKIETYTNYNDSCFLIINNEKYFSDSNTFLIKPLSHGKLPVSVLYKANDTWLTFTDTIFVKENKRISISGNPIICGQTPARLSVSDSFANFKWSNGDSTKNIAVSRPFKAFIFIADSVCAHSDTVEVFKVSRKNYIGQSREGICERDSVVISLSPSSNHAFITVGSDSTKTVTFHKPGDYVLNIHDSGCTFQDSISIFLHPRHRSVLSNNILACKDSMLTVPSLVSGALWQWQGKQTTTDTFRFIPVQSGKLILTTRLACPQVDTVAVEVRYCQRPKITFFIPTAFSPDANGLNDVYLPAIHEMRLEKMTVFNRWGQKVYEGNSGWDGNFNREKCPEGVYAVSLIYRHMYAPEEPLLIIRANVTLIR